MDTATFPRLATVAEVSTHVLFLAFDDAAFSTGTEPVATMGRRSAPSTAGRPS